MKIYNVLGFAIIAFQILLSALLAPAELGPYWGMAVGFGYLLISWFMGGLYLSDIIHLGISHRALDYKEWFIKTVTLINNAFFVYVDPVSWVNRHRLHHKFSDHDGDPNKLDSDGFWKTLYLCVFPYPTTANLASDDILKTWPFRLVSHPLFIVISPVLSCGLLYLFVRDWTFAIAVWAGVRVFALWVNMVQNYWTHDRRWGTRTYADDSDNAMNIGDWLPVMSTFSACWQNNHHHYPHLLRTTHAPGEFDFGYMTVRVMAALGLVTPSSTGTVKPKDLALAEVTL
jgi:stearoyl-CoA desaturase (delta-9 desaturase)